MRVGAARVLGGAGGFLLGVVCLDLLPPLGLAETICAIAVLVSRRPGACVALLVPTFLILRSAIAIMGRVSGPAPAVMGPFAVAAVLTAAAMIRGATAAEHVDHRP